MTTKGRGQGFFYKASRSHSRVGKEELSHTDRLAVKRLLQRLTNMDGEFRTYHVGRRRSGDRGSSSGWTWLQDQWPVRLFRTPCYTGRRRRKQARSKVESAKEALNLERNLRNATDTVFAIEEKLEVDWCPLVQYNEQQNGFKLELYNILQSILSIDGDISDLLNHETMISKMILDVCLKKRRLHHTPVFVVHREGVKLPKIDVSCSVEKDPLYVCAKFESGSPVQRINLVREHQLCFNCPQSSHFALQTSSNHKLYHMLLHSQFKCDGMSKTADQATKEPLQNSADDSPARHNSRLSCPVTTHACPVLIFEVGRVMP